jgi:hypothetical protein
MLKVEGQENKGTSNIESRNAGLNIECQKRKAPPLRSLRSSAFDHYGATSCGSIPLRKPASPASSIQIASRAKKVNACDLHFKFGVFNALETGCKWSIQ